MIVYHGTSLESARAIALAGFSPIDTNWSVSEPNTIYAWSPDRLGKFEELDSFEADEAAITRALESAQIAAARVGSVADYVVAIKLEVSEDLVTDDSSCEHMSGAVSFAESEPVKIQGYYLAPYSPSLRLFYLQPLAGNVFFEMPELSYEEEGVLKELNRQECYFDSLLIENYDFVENLF